MTDKQCLQIEATWQQILSALFQKYLQVTPFKIQHLKNINILVIRVA